MINNAEILFQNFDKFLNLPEYSKKLIKKCCGERIIDLLMHIPQSVQIRTSNIQQVLSTSDVRTFFNVIVQIEEHKIYTNRLNLYKICCNSEHGQIDLVFFNGNKQYLAKKYPIGAKLAVSGKAQKNNEIIEISHPDKVGSPELIKYWDELEPVYSLTAGLHNNTMRLAIKQILKFAYEIEEWIPLDILQSNGWMSFLQSIYHIHNPKSHDDICIGSAYMRRLAFDEILANQYCLSKVRKLVKSHTGAGFKRSCELAKLVKIPFELTQDQKNTLEEIIVDIESDSPMNRLVQGDVGSGKTVVSFLSMLGLIESGAQVAFIAPTEVLAIQHFEKIKEYTTHLNIKADLIIAKNRKQRDSQLICLLNNTTKIAIGTHALLEDNVKFAKLGLVVIDEQQRFGVQQRLKLIEKGSSVNALYLSATPIPRTLVLSLFGDLDVSVIKSKPKMRQSIETTILNKKKIMEIVDRIKEYQYQAYWICPYVEESEHNNVMDVTSRFNFLNDKIGSVGILHGKMKSDEKEKALNDFRNGKFKILVSTTVVEVGVDVPNANIIVIENAEKFGISQLHQLRGRVGRGDKKAYCVLLYDHPLSEDAIKRLNLLKSSNDGFALSEADLKIRGYGEILGSAQSGFNSFKIFDITTQSDLLDIACNLSQKMANNNTDASLLLKIYNKNEYLKLM